MQAHRLVYHSTLGLRVIKKKAFDRMGCWLTLSGVDGMQVSYFAEMCSGSEAGSYFRLIDLCITQL